MERERDNIVYWTTNGKINNDLQRCGCGSTQTVDSKGKLDQVLEQNICIYLYICIYTYIYIYVYICMYIYVYIYIYIYMYICVYAYMHM